MAFKMKGSPYAKGVHRTKATMAYMKKSALKNYMNMGEYETNPGSVKFGDSALKQTDSPTKHLAGSMKHQSEAQVKHNSLRATKDHGGYPHDATDEEMEEKGLWREGPLNKTDWKEGETMKKGKLANQLKSFQNDLKNATDDETKRKIKLDMQSAMEAMQEGGMSMAQIKRVGGKDPYEQLPTPDEKKDRKQIVPDTKPPIKKRKKAVEITKDPDTGEKIKSKRIYGRKGLKKEKIITAGRTTKKKYKQEGTLRAHVEGATKTKKYKEKTKLKGGTKIKDGKVTRGGKLLTQLHEATHSRMMNKVKGNMKKKSGKVNKPGEQISMPDSRMKKGKKIVGEAKTAGKAFSKIVKDNIGLAQRDRLLRDMKKSK